ncbi:MAG: hypothetical protein MJY62_03230 [Bacteroidales bacterium]|nr:hypothetical protein [Bacteroidales bacterium]
MAYKIPEETTPRCLECGNLLNRYDRSDKKFCCPSCKDKYHNDRKNPSRHLIRSTTAALLKNHDILDRLWETGFRMMDTESLRRRGFDTSLVTGVRRGRSGLIYECFDYVYRLSENRIFSINRVLSVDKVENVSLNLRPVENNQFTK